MYLFIFIMLLLLGWRKALTLFALWQDALSSWKMTAVLFMTSYANNRVERWLPNCRETFRSCICLKLAKNVIKISPAPTTKINLFTRACLHGEVISMIYLAIAHFMFHTYYIKTALDFFSFLVNHNMTYPRPRL